MITEYFTVKNKNRLIELQNFIKKEMPTCRFQQITKEVDKTYSVTINYDVSDLNKLHLLTNEWYFIDYPKTEIKQNSFLNKIKNIFKIKTT